MKTDVEDLYQLTIPNDVPGPLELDVRLSCSESVDLDLLVFETETLQVLSASEGPGPNEVVGPLHLSPGTYMVGVAWSGSSPASAEPYTPGAFLSSGRSTLGLSRNLSKVELEWLLPP